MAAFTAPNMVRFARPYGPITHPGAAVSTAPRTVDESRWVKAVIAHIEALEIIQEHTSEQITVPDLATVTDEIGNQIVTAAHILKTAVIESTWSGGSCEVPADDAPVPQQEGAEEPKAFAQPLTVQIGDRMINLGQVSYMCASARLAATHPTGDGRVRLDYLPGADNRVQIRHLPPAT
jgi:hypothetical protein